MCENNKRPIEKGEDRHPRKMMILHYTNNNIIISHPYYLGVYQDESENSELYQEIIVLGVGTKTKTTAETVVRVTHAITNI